MGTVTSTTASRTHAVIGQALARKEDARLVTGNGSWTDDIQMPGMLHMAFVRSPSAHARIVAIDTSAARRHVGVIAVFTGADLSEGVGGLPYIGPVLPEMVLPDHRPLAVREVRHVGDPVAVVVARDRYAAADAADLVDVTYEHLQPLVDVEAALADGAPLVHTDEGTNLCFTSSIVAGDVDAAFDGADVVVRRRLVNQRVVPTAIEPRALVCAPTPEGDAYTLYASTQIPHLLRGLLAGVTGLPEHRLHVVAPDVGGGFGAKAQVYPEDVVALLVAQRLGRPVKWTESRSEASHATHHGRDHVVTADVAADADGRLRALRVDVLANMGAYAMLLTPAIPLLGSSLYPGIYRMDAYAYTGRGVFTTTTPVDAYRGAGRPEATFVIERMMDELAATLAVDPLELRRRNWIPRDDFPFTTITGLVYDSGDYDAATTRAVELLGYDALRSEQARRRSDGDAVQLGIGVSTYTEMCGLSLTDGPGWETAAIRMLATGRVEVVIGTSPHGQGHETTAAQITAAALGVDVADVDVLHGDTRVAPSGLDTYGSRSLVVGGAAVQDAAARLVDKARLVAAHLLEADEHDIEHDHGRYAVAGSPDAVVTIREVAQAVHDRDQRVRHLEPELAASSVFTTEALSFPHGTHLCAVEVDTETGRTSIRSYVAVDDVGVAVNPLIVEGQVHGGVAQGIGQALYEEAVHDDAGNLLTSTLVDYLVPAAPDLPRLVTDRTVTPSTTNPLGAKGVGEAGAIASPPAVVNAVVDAVRHLGVTDVPMPCTPERVWRAIRSGAGANAHHHARGT